MSSANRKLKDPFILNDITKKAALATCNAAKRKSGLPDSFGLKVGAMEAKRAKSQAVPSNRSIMGRFKGNDSELLISVYKSELTIVKRSESEVVSVSRTRVHQESRTMSTGEAVEASDFSEEEVFKKFWLRGGIGENEIEVENYRIENPHLAPTHPSKLIGVSLFNFLNDNGVEKVEVILLNFQNSAIIP
jgi:hypothetical protein